MDTGGARQRLLIGEVADLLGITPKAIRHYEKLGLIGRLERSASGYRLYTAEDLLRLHRIKKLRSLGLSLERIKGVIGESDRGIEFEGVLEALLGEVESQIEHLEQRRHLLRLVLAGEDPLEEGDEPYVLELARRHLGERMVGIDREVLRQERSFWAKLDAFRWPRGYREFQEALVNYLANHPEEYEELLILEERLAQLAHRPEDSREAEQLAEDYAAYFEKSPLPEEISKGAALWSSSLETAFSGVARNAMSPAQRRCMDLLEERLSQGKSDG